MARQLKPLNQEKLSNQLSESKKSVIPEGEKELGKPVNRFEAMLFAEEVLCDLQSVYVLIDMLVEKGIINYNDFIVRLEKAKSDVKES